MPKRSNARKIPAHRSIKPKVLGLVFSIIFFMGFSFALPEIQSRWTSPEAQGIQVRRTAKEKEAQNKSHLSLPHLAPGFDREEPISSFVPDGDPSLKGKNLLEAPIATEMEVVAISTFLQYPQKANVEISLENQIESFQDFVRTEAPSILDLPLDDEFRKRYMAKFEASLSSSSVGQNRRENPNDAFKSYPVQFLGGLQKTSSGDNSVATLSEFGESLQTIRPSGSKMASEIQEGGDDDGVEGDEKTRNDNEEEDQSLSPWSFRIVEFLPGEKKGGGRIREIESDWVFLHSNIMGPPDWRMDQGMTLRDRETKLLSLGNGGILTLEVLGGHLIDGEGPDFRVFENVFRVNDGVRANDPGLPRFFIEPIFVSVAEDDDLYFVDFPCDAGASWMGCAGVTPTLEGESIQNAGGDAFDLSEIGVERAKYIRIRDSGEFLKFALSPGTEGGDIDSIYLIHTKKEKVYAP